MSRSEDLFNRAQLTIPGGVNSPVRAFRQVGGTPRFIQSARGAYLWDADGNQLIDYVGSWGPAILGHAHPQVVKAVQDAALGGLSFGAPCEAEVKMAERITQLMPAIEQVRLCSSGTEATMSALRLARGYTGRDLIVKFEGCYHGHADSLLVKAGSGALTLGVPTSPGVPTETAKYTLTLEYNNVADVERCFAEHGAHIAAVIVEPVAGNMNCILPVPGFLETLRAQCTKHGAILIFDEVMTGFRVALGGATARFGVTPDLITLGKVIGGGMPVGAFGGKHDIMQALAPAGPVYQAGTLSGNPVAMAAGLKTLQLIAEPGFYEQLEEKSQALMHGFKAAASQAGVALATAHCGGMFGFFFTAQPVVTCFAQATACDIPRFRQFFHAMLAQGVYLAPSAYEAGFVSTAHSPADLETTLAAAGAAFAKR